MNALTPLGDNAETELANIVDQMLEVKERRDHLDGLYSRLRDQVISLSGIGRRGVGSTTVTVSVRYSIDPTRATNHLPPDVLAKILGPAKIDKRIARNHLSAADFESCLSPTPIYTVLIG